MRDSRLIFHIDVNSAYLSWTAVEQLKHGADVDLREIPAIIGGDIQSRHGVVLAKSIPAKAYGIKTGEPVSHARTKCPLLVSYPPDHKLYHRYSQEFMALLATFCPQIEQVSVDECYLDFSSCLEQYAQSKMNPESDPQEAPRTFCSREANEIHPSRDSSAIAAAHLIKDKVADTFGFTVNIGISSNKLLAKMASDFQKPNRVHTLFPEEIPTKLWPLPVEKLYMVGRSSAEALHKLELSTIGDLAHTDPQILISHMKSHGRLIWEYANGIDDTPVETEESDLKCVGNSTTLPQDLCTMQEVQKVLRTLCGQVSERLKHKGQMAGLVTVELKYATFLKVSHQRQFPYATCDPRALFDMACRLFDELWNGEPIRLLGVRTSKLTQEVQPQQMSLFDLPRTQKEYKADHAMRQLQKRFGPDIIRKGW